MPDPSRVLVQHRIPESLRARIDRYADAHGYHRTQAIVALIMPTLEKWEASQVQLFKTSPEPRPERFTK
jgi:hypothetical protein